MNKFFETVEEYLENSNMTKEEKVAFIKAAGDFYRQQVDKEYNNYVRNQQIGAGIEIASAAIPGSAGIQENLRWTPHQGQNLSSLINDIKKAQKLPNEPNLKIEQKPFVSHYEVYRGNLGDHYIEKLNDGGRRYYITKDTLDGTHQSTNLGSIKSANNIIPSFLSDFNLPKWVKPQTATLGQIINNNI